RLKPVVAPRRGFSPTLYGAICKKKSLNVSSDFLFKNGGEGGIDSLCSPFGQFVRRASDLSNRLKPVVDPRRGFSPTLYGAICKKKV
ncbi:hypothetical protein NG99_17660, partial [Erwinia typographi]